MTLPLLQAGVFVASLLLTGLFILLARRVRLLDEPGQRSAHVKPTPVGGGISMVFLFLLVAGFYWLQGTLALPRFLALLGGGVIAAVGFVDDCRQLNLRWRLPVQVLAALWSLVWLGGVPAIDFGAVQLANTAALAVLAALALLWLLNLYNFMDGIDGLAGSEVVFVMLVSSFLLINKGAETLFALHLSLLAAAAGFLFWNWPPAKVFMGDVGSSFIGFTLGILALFSMQEEALTVWTWFILLGVFVVDATLTLARRVLSGARWYDGHACHAYQQATRHYGSHRRVTVGILLINCLWLTPFAWLSVLKPHLGFYFSVLALAPLVILAWKLGAGRTTAQTVPG